MNRGIINNQRLIHFPFYPKKKYYKTNMAKVNTLFKKGFLLAGVIMAANMFVINEMKAMDADPAVPANNQHEMNAMDAYPAAPANNQQMLHTINNYPYYKDNNINQEIVEGGNQVVPGAQYVQSFRNFLLSQNGLTLIGGAVFSVANNYLKWCDYNPGWYGQFGCFGWRSKSFLNGVLQFEVNFNLGRGIGWSIPNIIALIMTIRSQENEGKVVTIYWGGFFFIIILRGFTSMPLTFHISNFSISVSLDSIIWWGIIDNILIQR